MKTNDERDLRRRFAELRDDDSANAPPLSRLVRGPNVPAGTRRPRFVPAAALATAALVTAVLLVKNHRKSSPPIDVAIAQSQSMSSWTAPTDAWLTLSGLEIPDSVPSITPSSVTLPEMSVAATAQGEFR